MTNSEEEAVDRQIIRSFIAFALAIDDMCTLYSMLSVESKRVGFVENLNVVSCLNTAFHCFGSAQIGFSYYHIDL